MLYRIDAWHDLDLFADGDKTTGFMQTGAMVVRAGSKELVGICLQQMHGSTLDSVLLKATTRAMNAALVQQALHQVCPTLTAVRSILPT